MRPTHSVTAALALSMVAGLAAGVASASGRVPDAASAASLPIAGLESSDRATAFRAEAAQDLSHPHVPNSIIVKFRQPADGARMLVAGGVPIDAAAARDALIGRVGLTLTHSFRHLDATAVYRVDDLAGALAELRQHDDLVEYAQPNYLYKKMAAPNDALYADFMWGMNNTGQNINGSVGTPGSDINAEAAWDLFTGDPNLKVAVIDGGTVWSHPDLIDNIGFNEAEMNGTPGVDDDGNGYVDDRAGWDFYQDDNDTENASDDPFHGTHVSGTVGARGNNGIGVTGVNWQIQIVPLKFIGAQTGSTEDAIDALEYCIDNNIHISNNSWGGGPFDQGLLDVIELAGQMVDHVMIIAAGNDGIAQASYPAAYDAENIIAVANTTNTDGLSPTSQYNIIDVDLGAPGSLIASLNDTDGYSYASGTSMASPHVAGTVALLWGYRPELTGAQVKARILDTVRPVNSLQGRTVTGGVVDAGAALMQRPLSIDLTSLAPNGSPSQAATISVELDFGDDTLEGSVTLFYREQPGSYTPITMTPTGDGNYEAQVAITSCSADPEFYVRATGTIAGDVFVPAGGSSSPATITVGTTVLEDDFETAVSGWQVNANGTDTASTGAWQRGTPTATEAQPGAGQDGGACYATGLSGTSLGSNDVDEGTTTLASPVFDLADSAGARVSYYRWYSNDTSAAPNTDTFRVDVSNDGGATWVNAETVGPSGTGTSGGWIYAEWSVEDFVSITDQVRVRFVAEDNPAGGGSLVEAAIDNFQVVGVGCVDAGLTPCSDADLALPYRTLNFADVQAFLGQFNAQLPGADLAAPTGVFNFADVQNFLGQFGAGC